MWSSQFAETPNPIKFAVLHALLTLLQLIIFTGSVLDASPVWIILIWSISLVASTVLYPLIRT